nr:hypothetical protein BaRGS_029897 [Batillaria attramentaria]
MDRKTRLSESFEVKTGVRRGKGREAGLATAGGGTLRQSYREGDGKSNALPFDHPGSPKKMKKKKMMMKKKLKKKKKKKRKKKKKTERKRKKN